MPQNLPDLMHLREIKYGAKSSPALRSTAARAHLEAGRVAEALDLFLLAGDTKEVDEVRRMAIGGGRPLLLAMLERAGETVAAEDWKRAGDAAFADRRWREAFRAFTKAGDETALAFVREKIPGFELYTPQNK